MWSNQFEPNNSATIHVLPVNDIAEHSESDDCICHPKISYVDGGGKVVVHNSFDGREILERWEEGKQSYLQ